MTPYNNIKTGQELFTSYVFQAIVSELIKDKTAIFISHRMSSSVFCDRIIVIDGGKIQAIDTHKNLMKNTEGMYYKLFSSQSQYYELEQYCVDN